jgi:eukaryotic-like serine/threonine-protein kinase
MPVADGDLLSTAGARVGMVLRGKYRLDRVLGIGGMGCVYAATHLHNADRVAVKILHREFSVDAGIRGRFLREGDAANRVDHPGTVRVLDDDVAEDGSVFIVMDLLDGETLHARWARSGRKLAAREVVTLVCEVLDVLAAAHDKGIVHRDLKPENLFLTRDGRMKILDFGLARVRDSSPIRTGAGLVFGTPAFMAPEQALGKTGEIDALSDLWAVGATAFTLLTGRLVHEASTPEEMLVLSATRSVPAMASVVRDVPPIVAEVFDRALAFDKAERWPSARSMRTALAHAGGVVWSSEVPVETQATASPSMPPGPEQATLEFPTLPGVAAVARPGPPVRRWRRLNRLALVVGGIGVGIAVGVIATVSMASKQPGPSQLAPASSPGTPPSGRPLPTESPAPQGTVTTWVVPPADSSHAARRE